MAGVSSRFDVPLFNPDRGASDPRNHYAQALFSQAVTNFSQTHDPARGASDSGNQLAQARLLASVNRIFGPSAQPQFNPGWGAADARNQIETQLGIDNAMRQATKILYSNPAP